VTLVEDERLEHVAMALGGLDREQLLARRAFVGRHVDGVGLPSTVPPEPERLLSVAMAATWLTLALEAAVALTFALPLGRLGWLRHVALLSFCTTTYAIAPVVGFGWLLLAMGVSQCELGARRLRAAYVGVFALLVFYAGALS